MSLKNSFKESNKRIAKWVFGSDLARRVAEERRRIRRYSLRIIAFVFVSFLILGIAAMQMTETSRSSSSYNRSLNCQNPQNKNTPYCQDKQAEVEQGWNAIARSRPSSPNQFTLHREGSPASFGSR